jgi:fructan beta-fructosidase
MMRAKAFKAQAFCTIASIQTIVKPAVTRTEPYRPHYHFTPERNWINDPNGLVWFEGEYHLFYQYNPFGEQWGHMSWGHAVSTDGVNWQELPVAIPEDARTSIFSGSVVVDTRNTSGFGRDGVVPLVAIYTGCLRRPEGGQAQELAYSLDRGRTWQQYALNPVLDLGLRDFRDPKVFWHASTGRWVMAVVLPDDRTVQFYGSANLLQWQLLSAFSSPFEGEGIWECPDLVAMPLAGEGERWLFKVDVFGGHPSGGTGARIFFGHFDGTRFLAEPESAPQWADFGADFYAALSWGDLPAGHPPLWLAWLSCHRYAKHLPSTPWRGAMTVPRTLALQRVAGQCRLLQQPWPGLQALRLQPVRWPAMNLEGEGALLLPENADGRAVEVVFSIDTTEAAVCGLRVHAGGGRYTQVGYDADKGTVFIDRGHSGFAPEEDALYGQRREVLCARPVSGQALLLRVLVDASSVEVFAGQGELTLTEQTFPAPQHRGLKLFSEGGRTAFGEVQAWPLQRAALGLAR